MSETPYQERVTRSRSRSGLVVSVLLHGAIGAVLVGVRGGSTGLPGPDHTPPRLTVELEDVAEPSDEPEEPAELPPSPARPGREPTVDAVVEPDDLETLADLDQSEPEPVVEDPWRLRSGEAIRRRPARRPPVTPFTPSEPSNDPAPGAAPPARPAPAAAEPFVPAEPIAELCAKPVFPRIAVRRSLAGLVILIVDVDAQGRVSRVRMKMSSGHRILDRAAVKAIETWRFEPARRGGLAVPDRREIPIRFRPPS